jgi:alpha-mannosidase
VEQVEQNTYKKLICYSRFKLPEKLSDDRISRSHNLVNNTVISTITLIAGVPRIDIHTEIDNQVEDHRLRVHFPSPFSNTEAMHDGHFEVVQRPIGIPASDSTWEESPRGEVPQRQFTSIADEHISLTVANFGLPEVEVFRNTNGNSEISITLLRCVGWLSRDDLTTRKSHAGPMEVAVPGAQMKGKFSFDYSIIPGNHQWRDSIPQAFSFNTPLKSTTTTLHPGTLPSMCSLIENTNSNFMLTTIKTAEDRVGLIVRGCNLLSSQIETTLRLITPIKRVQMVSLDERLIETIPVSPEGTINLKIGGHKIVTLRIEF